MIALLPLVNLCIDSVEQRVSLLSDSMVRVWEREINANSSAETIIEAIDAYWHTTQRQRRNSTDSHSELPFAFISNNFLAAERLRSGAASVTVADQPLHAYSNRMSQYNNGF